MPAATYVAKVLPDRLTTAQFESSAIGATFRVITSTANQRVYQITVTNPGVAEVYLKFWNTATPTVGTDAPEMQIAVPASVTDKVYVWSRGVKFSTAISVACVQEAGTAGTTAPASSVSVAISTGA